MSSNSIEKSTPASCGLWPSRTITFDSDFFFPQITEAVPYKVEDSFQFKKESSCFLSQSPWGRKWYVFQSDS